MRWMQAWLDTLFRAVNSTLVVIARGHLLQVDSLMSVLTRF